MYQLSTPSFRFVVFLVEESRYKNSNGQQTQTTCYANTYEVNSDGSITFYQIGLHGEKRVKVPVLTYPHGKWTGIVLIDDNNQFPVFNGSASFNTPNPSSQAQFSPNNFNNSNIRQNENRNDSRVVDKVEDVSHSPQEEEINHQGDFSQTSPQSEKADDLDSVIDLFDDNTGTSNSNQIPVPQQHGNPNWNRNNQSNQGSMNPNMGHMPNKGIPGISQNMNPNDFKKAKNELLESQIKDYVKYNPLFNLEEVVVSANKEARAKKLGNISDTDVIWVASNLIREKTVQTRKFVEPVIQKNLSHMLPDIMRRQWSGKMGPILQVLEEREETKNVTAIDLAVWMVQNNFE